MVNYEILSIEYLTNVDGLEKVAANLHWFANATNEEGAFVRSFGNTHIDVSAIDNNNFTPFEDLTKEQVLNWLFTAMGDDKQKLETFMDRKLNEGGEEERQCGLPSSW